MKHFDIEPDWKISEESYGLAYPASGPFRVNGLDLELIAFRVTQDSKGELETFDLDLDLPTDLLAEGFTDLDELVGEDSGGTWKTTSLPGLEGEWVIVAHPEGADA